MKKVLITIAVVVVVLLAGVIFSLNGIVKNGVETFGPQITRTNVTLDSANISAFSGNGSLKGLLVGSPQGFKSDYVFSLKDISVDMKIGSLLSDTLVINEILIDSPDIIYELSKNGLNITTLLKNAKSSTNQKAAEDSSGEKSSQRAEKKVVIENLKIKNGKVTMAANLLGNSAPGASIPLPDIHLRDIGKETGGTSFEAAAAKILGAVSQKIARAGISPDQFRDAAGGVKGTLEDVADKLQGLFN